MNKKLVIGGLVPAPCLPFDEQLKINASEFGSHIKQIGQTKGVGGVAVNGHAGEVTGLTPEERQEVIKIAKANVPSWMPVLGGVEALGMEAAIKRTREAKAAGADGALVLPPFDYLPYRALATRPNAAYTFFKTLSDEVDLPIVVFLYPKETGLCYPLEELQKIADIENVVGLKAALHSCEEYFSLYCALKGKISVLAANDSPDLLGMMMLGADGSLVGVSNIGTAYWAQFVTACLESRYDEARDMFLIRLAPLTDEIYGSGAHARRQGGLNACAKEALVQLGVFSSSRVRPPEPNVTDADRQAIRKVLRQTGLIKEKEVTAH